MTNSQLTCQHRVLKKPLCLQVYLALFPHIVTRAPPSLVDFLVYNVLFYQCISDVLIVMFIRDMCSCAFICLVLLVDGVHPIPAFKKTKK